MKNQIGSIVWQDLTITNAELVRDFYKEVVGWESEDHPMGSYNDYNIINPNTNEVVTGICHSRGVNKDIPPQWLMYVRVNDVHESINRCIKLGGKVIDGPRLMGNATFCVIEDPAKAVIALMSYKD